MTMLVVTLRLFAILALCAFLVHTVRVARSRSPLLGLIVMAGMFLHALSAAALFVVAWLDLPFVASMRLENGFWKFAPDAGWYYSLAANAAWNGLGTVTPTDPSPAYIRALGLWMQAFGIHPGTPLLFNLTAFSLACLVIVRVSSSRWHSASPAAIAWPLIALSFSPVLLVCGTQVLKDVLFATLITISAASALALCPYLASRPLTRAGLPHASVSLLGLWMAVYMISGIRAYFGAVICISLAAAAVVTLLIRGTWRAWRFSLANAAVAILLCTAFILGAGPYYYVQYRDIAIGTVTQAVRGTLSPLRTRDPIASESDTRIPATVNLSTKLQELRKGFVRSGGQTNLASAHEVDANRQVSVESAGANTTISIAIGIAGVFVPISLLQMTGAVQIGGSRSLLLISDIDTLFIDLMMLATTWILIRQRHRIGDRTYVLFCLALALTTTILMAYVVTNFGTLMRLRVIGLIPFWMAPLALSSSRRAHDVAADVV